MHTKKYFVFALLIVAAMVLASCGGGGQADDGKTKVAFIYIGQAGALGWIYEHDRGRLALEDALGGRLDALLTDEASVAPTSTDATPPRCIRAASKRPRVHWGPASPCQHCRQSRDAGLPRNRVAEPPVP